MLITVNGAEQFVAEGCSVAALVRSVGAPESGRGVAVAVDGTVVPRSAWDDTELAAGARVEVLVAVQGG